MDNEKLKIDLDGVQLSPEAEKKVFVIKSFMDSFASSSESRLRIIKAGQRYEGLLCGRTIELPIQIYQRGSSISQVLDGIYKLVRKNCSKALKVHHGPSQRSA
ncbi:hypothetical protein GW916_05780 [bacterium]|nr:hypothetical protein [bacterium]